MPSEAEIRRVTGGQRPDLASWAEPAAGAAGGGINDDATFARALAAAETSRLPRFHRCTRGASADVAGVSSSSVVIIAAAASNRATLSFRVIPHAARIAALPFAASFLIASTGNGLYGGLSGTAGLDSAI